MSGNFGNKPPVGAASSESGVSVKKSPDGSGMSTRQKQVAGGTLAGAGFALETLGTLNQSSANRDVIRANEKAELRDARLSQRSNIGSMIAQSSSSGLTLNSFEDIFNNQTIEDAKQITGIKQAKEDAITADRNAKRGAIIGSAVKAANKAATLGMSQ